MNKNLKNIEWKKPILYTVSVDAKTLGEEYEIDHDWLWDAYVTKEYSIDRIAKILRISHPTVLRIILKHKIPKQVPRRFYDSYKGEEEEKPDYYSKEIGRVILRRRELPDYAEYLADKLNSILDKNGGILDEEELFRQSGLSEDEFYLALEELRNKGIID